MSVNQSVTFTPCGLVEPVSSATLALDSRRLRSDGGQLPAAREGGVVSKSGNGANASANKLHFGDNLDVLRNRVKDESIDLVYLDPPFNSQANYNVLFKEPGGAPAEAQVEAFRDTWEWGDSAAAAYDDVMRGAGDVAVLLKGLRSWLGENAMMAYLCMMAVRLLALRQVMKPTASLYLHCDPKASHYLKLILDAIFQHENFRSEVIWRRTGSHNKATRWAPIHDVILFYTMAEQYTWNNPRRPYMLGHVKEHFELGDDGRYRTAYYGNVLTGSGTRRGESGEPWKGIDPTAKGRHWAIPGKLWEDCGLDATGLSQHQKLDALYDHGFITLESGAAWPMYERVIRPDDGPAASDLWTFQPYTEGTVFGTELGIDDDVRWLSPRDAERIGYPTQKPVSLLERIIRASSKEGDVVLDPFCGCGTTIEAAENTKRQWVGIDVTHYAVTLIESRLQSTHPGINYNVEGRPTTLAGARDLAQRDKFQFEWWAAWRLGAQTYRKRGADRGIDGNIFFKNGPYGDGRIIVSVKGGEHVGVDMVRDLRGVIEREEAEMGIMITLAEPTKPMMAEATNAGFVRKSAHGRLPRLQIVTIEELLDNRLPKLPPLPVPEQHPIRAPRRRDRDQLEFLLPFAGEMLLPDKDAIIDPRFVRFR
jgi:DNA modification methylase